MRNGSGHSGAKEASIAIHLPVNILKAAVILMLPVDATVIRYRKRWKNSGRRSRKINPSYNKISNMQIGKLLSALAIIIIAVGCNSGNFKKTKGGMPYKLFSSGKGPKLQSGEI